MQMSTSDETRPATTTFMGDTGLWFVPTGEVLPARQVVLQRVPRELRLQPGIHRRVELAGDLRRRPRRPCGDLRRVDGRAPHRPRRAAAVPHYPRPAGRRRQRVPVRAPGLVRQPARRPLARREGQPDLRSTVRSRLAFALRGMVKLPTAKDDEEGVGTGKLDFAVRRDRQQGNQRARRARRASAASSSAAIPTASSLTNGFRWGFGAGFPSRAEPAADRGTARRERTRTIPSRCRRRSSARTVRSPRCLSDADSPLNASVGLTWQGRNGSSRAPA